MKGLKLNIKAKLKKLLSMKHSRLVIILIIIAVAAALLLTNTTIRNKIFGSKNTVTQRTAAVKKGNIQVVVSGSGPIYFTNEKKLYSKINATITKVNFKEGDKVKAGDVIAEFDDSDAQNTINDSNNNLAQNQLSAQSSYSDAANLTIRAPFSGQVSGIQANTGDTVQKGGTILTITDTSKLKVSLSYNASDIGKIAVGQSADVYISALMESVKGTVTYKSNDSAATSSGGKVYSVEIQMNNPGALLGGMAASADIYTSSGTVTSTGSASLNYVNKQTVTSSTGGTVQTLNVKENQRVSTGAVLAVMQNDAVTIAKQSADLKLAGSQNQINTNMKLLDKYKVVAPIDGVITKISFKEGDAVKPGDEVSDVVDPTQMQFDIPVDELDIAKIALGQKTSITVDALPDTTANPIQGEVSKIPVEGTTTNGVTTFPVTIKIDSSLNVLKGGLNANADIEVSNEENVLYVPIEAVSKIGTKSYVMVKGNGTSGSGRSGFQFGGGSNSYRQSSGNSNSNSANSGNEASVNTKFQGQGGSGSSNSSNRSSSRNSGSTSSSSKNQNYYANAVRKEVQVGANNDSYIEIKSGLSEEDIVILPQLQTSSTSSTQNQSGLNMGRTAGVSGGGSFNGGGNRGGGN